MKRITIFLIVCAMTLVCMPTLAYAEVESDFNDRVESAISQVMKKYPHAKLHEVHGQGYDPTTIESLELIFSDVIEDDYTIVIEETEHGIFDLSEPIKGKWDDNEIEWPVNMDLSEADALLKEDADRLEYDGSYDTVSLESPFMTEGPDSTYFIFGRDKNVGPYILVDTTDGTVDREKVPVPGDLSGPRVKLGTQCISRIAPKFAGGRWQKGDGQVDVICEKNPNPEKPLMRHVETTECKSRDGRKSRRGRVNNIALVCRER